MMPECFCIPASAYQHLPHVLSIWTIWSFACTHVPLLWHDVDALSTALAEFAKTAACDTMPQAFDEPETFGEPARKS